MAIKVRCTCGTEYDLKDEFAGRKVECPQCRRVIEVPGSRVPEFGHPAFNRDKFLLRQKRISISEKYYVWDEDENTILFVVRPAHLFRNLLAAFMTVAFFMVSSGSLIALGVAAAKQLSIPEAPFVIAGLFFSLLGAAFVAVALIKKRHVTFYAEESAQTKLLEVFQDKKFEFIKATYTVNDAEGNCVAKLQKNYLYNFFRKRWYCLAPDDSILCLAKEDSVILSLLRRFLGTFFGLLRTNFIIVLPETDEVIGEFNRKFTLFDRYVLDMTADPGRKLDRRVAIALGIMLDTGERR
ncbi:MAG: hypothetical protein O3B01_07430 [Planctomycetota bacterium]|nr:hypothetical protein [Planctomycetota bacterium]MDA1138401.1 hypothetical protein [Planctomycetota bacterium]